MFSKSFADEYHTVQFCKYNNSLRTVVASMPFDGINDDDYTDFNELVSAKNKVLHLCDEHTLIIVDNFNVTYDEFLREFLPSNNKNFKVIFTTRCKPASDYYGDKVYELPKLSEEECKIVFRLHSQIDVSKENEKQIEDIIKKTDYNTLIIILMARTLKKTGISLSEILEKLDNQELKSIEQKIFHEYDISNDEIKAYNAMYAHLNVVFSVSVLSDAQKEILKNATLISAEGLGVADFVSACDKSIINNNSVFELAEWGWININSDETITMHPIISDLVSANDLIKKEDSYYHLAEALEDYCNGKKVITNDFISVYNGERGQKSPKIKTTDLPKEITKNLLMTLLYMNPIYIVTETHIKKVLSDTQYGERLLPISWLNWLIRTVANIP